MNEPLLKVSNLVQEFTVRDRGGVRSGTVQAVSDVSFSLAPGETLGLVGETGSGKSTLARSILQSPRPKAGSVRFRGTELVGLKGKRLLQARRHVQTVFQDPFGSLDPTWRVNQLVEEPLVAFKVGSGAERRRRVQELLDKVGLDPSLIICDEAVSSLDVLIRAQVLNLLERLRTELELAYLFIAHDLAMVKQVSDRVAVMYLGKLVEVAPSDALYRAPMHPYTVALMASIPSPDPARRDEAVDRTIHGEPPSPIDPPSGCRFRTRCPRAQSICASEEPPLRELAPGHLGACHFPVTAEAPAPAATAVPQPDLSS
jgi:oligopeptide/dipeptide ABC transporter ATP-binding protein